MKIKVVWLGRPSSSPFEEQIETYRRRVHRRWPAEDLPVRPAAGGRNDDPRRALKREAEAVLGHCPEGWPLVVLDERGKPHDSPGLARWLGTLEESGTTGLVFVVGSDLGLDSQVIEAAGARISLSQLTLPHLLVRLVLWEQLFRSTSILSGGAYHRVCVQ